MHKPTTWRKSRICRTKDNSQRFYHYTHTFSIPYNAHNFGMEGSIKKLSRISLKIVTQCCAYLNNDKMRQVVGLCKYSHISKHADMNYKIVLGSYNCHQCIYKCIIYMQSHNCQNFCNHCCAFLSDLESVQSMPVTGI